VNQVHRIDQSISILTAELPRSDEIEPVTSRCGTAERAQRDRRLPDGGARRIFSKDVSTPILVAERDRFLSPIDGRIVILEPCHAEDDVEAAQLGGDEVQRLGVRADANGCLGQNAAGRGAVTVCQADGVGMLIESQAELPSEGRRNEIARGAAVDEHDCGMGAEGARKLDELACELWDGVRGRWRGW